MNTTKDQQEAKDQLFHSITLWGEANGYRWNSRQLLVMAEQTEAYMRLLAGNIAVHPNFWATHGDDDLTVEEESVGILWAIPQEPIHVEQLYPNGEPHHITLQYGVKRKDWLHLEGREFDAVIWETCWSDRVQLLRVRIPTDIPCCNAHPHITVSWVDGAEPKESNTVLVELMTGKHQFLPWNPRRHIRCRIEFQEHEKAEEGDRCD